MGIPRQEPPDEGCSNRERIWSYVSVPCGARLIGWLAGPPFWVPTHHVGKTKPCRAGITKGELTCSLDHTLYPLDWKGLLPWWDEKGKPKSVWVSQPLREYLAALEKHVPILITRGKNPKDPVDITADDRRVSRLLNPEQRHWPADPSPTLLTWWKDLELSKWCRDQGGRGKVPADTPAGKALTRELAAALAAGAGDGASDSEVSPADRNEAFARAARGARPGKNGRH